MTERLLSTKEAANLLGMNRSFLDHARLNGRGPAYIRIGRIVKYRMEDLQAYTDQNRTDPACPKAEGI